MQMWSHNIWQPGSKVDFVRAGSATESELKQEAAVTLQRFVRNILYRIGSDSGEDSGNEGVDESGDSTDKIDQNDGEANSQINLAVRRAFMASICSGHPQATTPDDTDLGNECWTMDDVTRWLDETFDQVRAAADAVAGARLLWSEWALVEGHFPRQYRQGVIKMLDKKLQAVDLPSLRELIYLQDT